MLLKQFTLKLEEFEIKAQINMLLENLDLAIVSRNNTLEIKDDIKANDYRIHNDSDQLFIRSSPTPSDSPRMVESRLVCL
jgi:hypothetical protein